MSDLRRLVVETRVCVSQHKQNTPSFFIFLRSGLSFYNVLSIYTHNQNDGDSPCIQGQPSPVVVPDSACQYSFRAPMARGSDLRLRVVPPHLVDAKRESLTRKVLGQKAKRLCFRNSTTRRPSGTRTAVGQRHVLVLARRSEALTYESSVNGDN